MRGFGFFILLFILVGCGTGEKVSTEDIAAFDVKQTFAETVEGDYMLQVTSAKPEYEAGEKVELYAETTYTGQGSKTISHSAQAVIFSITEKVRGYTIPFAVQEIGMQTELESGKPYRETYLKQGIFTFDQDEKDFREFIEDFKQRDDFPPGYYVVEVWTDFHDGEDYRNLLAEVDFKVLPSED